MSKGKLIVVPGTMGVDAGTTGQMDTANDTTLFDVSGLENISIFLNQIVDAGVDGLLVEKTIDGVNWATVATKADTDFPAGANKSVELTLSDSNGMPTVAKQIKVTLTAKTSTAAFTATCAGRQIIGYA